MEFSPEDQDLNQALWLPPWLAGHRNTTAGTRLRSPNPSSSCTSRSLGPPRGVPPRPALCTLLLSVGLCVSGRAKGSSSCLRAAFSTHQSLAPSAEHRAPVLPTCPRQKGSALVPGSQPALACWQPAGSGGTRCLHRLELLAI